MNPLLYPIAVPILLGTICLVIPRKIKFICEFLSFIGAAGTFGFVIWLFLSKPEGLFVQESLIFRLDNLSGFVLLAIGLFGFLITLYSMKYMQGKEKLKRYYGALLWTLGAACGAVLANHLMLLLVFWGFLGVTLYLLILTGSDNAAPVAKKTLIIIGGSDALILLGIVFIFTLTKTFEIDKIFFTFDNFIIYLAFILLAIGVFAKIGAFPLHSWVPDMSEEAPLTSSAMLPGSLDKLLGIYLLARLSLNLFELSGAMHLMLLIIGSITVIISAVMGLMQDDVKKVVGYLVITGAGYMLLGFGTGNPTGLAGGLFYMLSSALWTSCLYLSIGNVEFRTGQTGMKNLGGLGKAMPFTFVVSLVAVLAISGIPPLNGFASKWMIYQGLIDLGRSGDRLWIIWLVIAMFGSAVTFAIGVKMIHSVFLGVTPKTLESKKIRDVGFIMSFSPAVLTLLCLVFGIFAFSVPMKMILLPLINGVTYIGAWNPGFTTILILVGLLIGFIIYVMGNLKGIREANAFIGGEMLADEDRVTGANFYNTVRDSRGVGRFYKWIEAKYFDLYEQCCRLSESIAELFRKLHTGILTMYLMWVIMGLFIILIVLMGR